MSIVPLDILVLDDEKVRHDLFAKIFKDHRVVHVYTAEEAMAALTNGPVFDEIWLDHDLGDGQPDGKVVARAAADMPEDRKPGRAVMHSLNRPGACDMGQTMKDAGIRVALYPFTKIVDDHS